jgi:hypothetical protein
MFALLQLRSATPACLPLSRRAIGSFGCRPAVTRPRTALTASRWKPRKRRSPRGATTFSQAQLSCSQLAMSRDPQYHNCQSCPMPRPLGSHRNRHLIHDPIRPRAPLPASIIREPRTLQSACRHVSLSTITSWLDEYKQHCSYRRLRREGLARFPANQTDPLHQALSPARLRLRLRNSVLRDAANELRSHPVTDGK